MFIHIPKTGGSSLLNSFQREYGSSLYHIAPNRADPRGYEEFLATPKSHLRAVVGHVAYGIHGRLPMAVDYVTMLRDPSERAQSEYHHIRRHPSHPLHEQVMRHDRVEDYLTSRCSASTDNLQTRMLAGHLNIGTQSFDRPVSESDLARALENLATCTAVGFTERYDASLIHFADALDWKRPVVRFKQNTAPKRGPWESVNQALVDFDNRLYAEAMRTFAPVVSSARLTALAIRSVGPQIAQSVRGWVKERAPSRTASSVKGRDS